MVKSIETLNFTAIKNGEVLISKKSLLNVELSKVRQEILNAMYDCFNVYDINVANKLINNINVKGYHVDYKRDNDNFKLTLTKVNYDFNKYELTDISDLADNGQRMVYRIKALYDIPKYGVKKGDLGGYVENLFNLSQYGECWIDNNAKVFGNAYVSGDAYVGGNAQIFDNAYIHDCANVDGCASVCCNAEVYDNAIVTDNAEVFDECKVYGNAKLMGVSQITDSARVFGNAEMYQYAYAQNFAMIYGNAKLDGNCVIRDYAKVHGNARVTNDTIIGHKTELCPNNENKENNFMKQLKNYSENKENSYVATYAKLLFDELNK